MNLIARPWLSSLGAGASLGVPAKHSLVRRRPSSRLSSRLHRPHRPLAVHRELIILIAQSTSSRSRVVRCDGDAAAELKEVALPSLAQGRLGVVAPRGLGDVGLDNSVDLVRETAEELDDFLGDEDHVAHVAESNAVGLGAAKGERNERMW